MLDKAKQMQWLNGFDVGRARAVNISHLHIADDRWHTDFPWSLQESGAST